MSEQDKCVPLGLAPSFGFGDRIGLATPGHVESMKRSANGIQPIFPQQSIREMTRTQRTPQQVMDDAMTSYCTMRRSSPMETSSGVPSLDMPNSRPVMARECARALPRNTWGETHTHTSVSWCPTGTGRHATPPGGNAPTGHALS